VFTLLLPFFGNCYYSGTVPAVDRGGFVQSIRRFPVRQTVAEQNRQERPAS